ncbi:hypothetical protein DFH09DRAFT_1073908 [Mycena vulgaris]|nr:hypothetical protein DFH09DRAFT_1073908 [Mycena vulgaris]
MLPPLPSSPAPSRRPSYEAALRRSEPFYMHDEDSFYSSRADLEAGCLIPPDADSAVPDLTSTKTNRDGIYAAYRRWFRRASAVRLPVAEKGERTSDSEDSEPSSLERRIQAGAWSAMLVLLFLTIYFLMREA